MLKKFIYLSLNRLVLLLLIFICIIAKIYLIKIYFYNYNDIIINNTINSSKSKFTIDEDDKIKVN